MTAEQMPTRQHAAAPPAVSSGGCGLPIAVPQQQEELRAGTTRQQREALASHGNQLKRKWEKITNKKKEKITAGQDE